MKRSHLNLIFPPSIYSGNTLAGVLRCMVLGLSIFLWVQCTNTGAAPRSETALLTAGNLKNTSGRSPDPGSIAVCSCPSSGHLPGCPLIEFFPEKTTSTKAASYKKFSAP